MWILSWLFPKNYIPDSERPVADYHTSTLRSQSKYDASKRPRGMSASEWNDWANDDVKAQVLRDMDRLDAEANAARWENAKYYAAHPQELKHLDPGERPSEKLLQAAQDYHAGKKR